MQHLTSIRILNVWSVAIKMTELTAEQEDHMIESQLEQIREDREKC